MVGRVAGGLTGVVVALGLAALIGFRTFFDPTTPEASPTHLAQSDSPTAADARLEGRAEPATASRNAPADTRTTLGGLVLLGDAPSQATVQVWRFKNGWGLPHVHRRLSHLRPYGDPLRVGPDGRFELEAAVPSHFRLLATRGAARGSATVQLRHVHATPPIVVTLAAGQERLAGIALDDGGRPVQGRLVLRRIPGDDGIPVAALRSTAADAEGRFAFADLPAGRVTVGVERDGGALFWGPVVESPYEEPYRLVVAPHARTVAVQVVDDATGRALPGVEVLALAKREVDRGRWIGRDTVGGRRGHTDDDGRVLLAVPDAPLLVVQASHDGYLDESATVAEEATSATLRLKQASRVVGTVRHHVTRDPVGGVSVRAGQRVDVTDTSGRFVLEGLRLHDASVSVWGPELVPHGELRQRVDLRTGETTSVELLVAPGIIVHGRVVTSDGEPVAGARVWLHRTQSHGVHIEVLARFQDTTDEAGAFGIRGVPGGGHASDFEVHAKGPGRGKARTPLESRALMHGQTARRAEDPIEIVLPDPRYARVRAEDAQSGTPVSGVRIRADAFTEAVTGEDGWARLGPLAPGRHSLSTQAAGWKLPGHGQQRGVVEIPDQGEGEVVLRLQRTCRIAGRIAYADGTPADDRSFGIGVRGDLQTFWTDCHGGRFHFGDLARDTYEVTIVLGGMEVAVGVGADDQRIVGRATIVPDQTDATILLNMKRPSSLEILVFGGDGQPLAQADVHFLTRTVDEQIESGVSIHGPRRVSEGRLVLSGLEAPVWLTVEPLPGPGAKWARRRLGPIQPGTPRVEVRLEAAHRIRGFVVDEAGEPVSGIPVEVWPDDTPQVFVDRSTSLAGTESGADGSFVFDRLPLGRHWLSCYVPDAFGGFQPIPVDAGVEDALMRLHRRRAFRITILSADGLPLPNANIACHEPPWYGSKGREYRTGEDGVAAATGLDDRKRYTLEVKQPHRAKGHQTLTIHDWEPADVTLRLDAMHVARGRVVDALGQPAVGARILVHTEDGKSHSASATDAEGRFEVHLPTGARVHLEAEDFGKRSEAVPVSPGGAEVELVVRERDGVVSIRLQEWPTARPPEKPWQRQRHMATVWREDRPSWIDRPQVSLDGRIEIEGLDPAARYSVFYRHPDDGRVVVRLSGLVPDGKTVHATPSSAMEWMGRVRLKEGVHFSRLAVVGSDLEVRELREDGSYVIHGLPRGTWQVQASASWHGTTVSARVEARDGQIPDIVFDTR